MNIVIFNSSDGQLKKEKSNAIKVHYVSLVLSYFIILTPNSSYYNFDKTTLPYLILENGKESRISLRLHSLRWE